jgi:hypothetical protein
MSIVVEGANEKSLSLVSKANSSKRTILKSVILVSGTLIFNGFKFLKTSVQFYYFR